jgi:pyruvate dehydrogenase E2 component (dihydrolipoamide acetyltransferase)
VTDFILPNLGEGVAQGDVLRVLVKPGDTIKQDQAVLELETDKATLEVPSSVEGVVREIRVKAGDKVKPGQAILSVDGGDGDGAKPAEAKSAEKAAAPAEKKEEKKEEPTPEKAGASTPTEHQEESPAGTGGAATKGKASVVDIRERQSAQTAHTPSPAASQAPQAPTSAPAPAAPSVRRLAREIGVDIAQVTGSGAQGRISEEDVKNFARHVMSSVGGGAIVPAAPGQSVASPSLPDFSKWGEVERKAMSGIRRKTSEHLSHAWRAIAHVTQFDKADMTLLEEMRPKYAPEAEKLGGKLTVTAIAAKIVASALKKFPQFNSSIDPANESIIYKKYVHVGIAVDTEHGLLVPVVRNADQKNILQIAVEIQQLAEKAKARKLSIEEMSGGSMSITNLGGIGGTAFTPIVNWPEVAILGISRGAIEPVYRNGSLEPRQMLPLSLSYDHRVIDGADAIRFLRWVVDAIEQPFTLALRG